MRREVAVPASRLAALPDGRFLRAELAVPAWMANGALATSLLVGKVAGVWRAYANVCMHHPVPLDEDSATVMSEDGRHLCCHQHGAIYRPEDGLCVDGPCRGERLYPAGIEERPEGLVLFVDG